jgi:tetratricopeptide (TPR) repeat protein
MYKRFKISITCILLPIFLGASTTDAQLFQDSVTLNLIKRDIDCIYNMQFKEAQDIHMKIKKLHPGHPVLLLLKGMQTYWKNYPMLSTNSAHISFEEDLRQCIRLSGKNKVPAYEPEYLLTNLCARGMLLEYYNVNNLTFDVIPLATSTYGNLRHAFNFTNVCTDLQYYTGVYNYYREAYPKANPGYKPLVFLLPSGNIKTGLKELHNADGNGVVLRAESYYLLAGIYLNFENKYQQAVYYSKTLNKLYPDNAEYLAMYIKNLLLLKQYDEAEKLIITSQKEMENKYFLAQLSIFQGLLKEKKYHDNNLAEQYYHSGISKLSFFGTYGNEWVAYGYYGLSRISEIKKETNNGKKFREKALKLATFKKINFDI